MKAGELWAVVWCDRTLFSVRPLGEVMEVNRRGVCDQERAKDFSPLLVLDLAADLPGANGKRLELEKARFGHAVCGRRAGDAAVNSGGSTGMIYPERGE